MEKFGGLTSLAQASFDELQTGKGIGQSKSAAIKSADAAFKQGDYDRAVAQAQAALRDDPGLKLDQCSNVTGVDWPEKEIVESTKVTTPDPAGGPQRSLGVGVCVGSHPVQP